MKKIFIAVFTVFIMIVAACGGSDNESSGSTPEEAPASSAGTSQESSSSGVEDSDGNDPRETIIGLISVLTGLENENYVACIVDSVAESEGLTYEEILEDITSEESQTDEAAAVTQGDSPDSLRSSGEFQSKKPRGSGPQVSLGLS